MNRHPADAGLERFVLCMAMFLLMLLAGLVAFNYSDGGCEGGWRLLSIPCHDPYGDHPRC